MHDVEMKKPRLADLIQPGDVVTVGSRLEGTFSDSHFAEVPANYSHYFKDVSHLTTVDVYRVLELFNVTDPCLQHAIKKLLVAGGRGVKDIRKDVNEAIVSLTRWQEMRKEDHVKHNTRS